MFQGQLLGIFVAKRKGTDPAASRSCRRRAGPWAGQRSLLSQGGNLFGQGRARPRSHAHRGRGIEGLAREYEITLQPAQTRRNLLTPGVPLNHLVGKTFSVGGSDPARHCLCEPCGHLEKLTCKGVEKGLIHRADCRHRC